MKYVFNVRPRLLYVIFRFCKFSVPVLRFGITNNPVQKVSVLFVLLVNIIKIWCRFRVNAFFTQMIPSTYGFEYGLCYP